MLTRGADGPQHAPAPAPPAWGCPPLKARRCGGPHHTPLAGWGPFAEGRGHLPGTPQWVLGDPVGRTAWGDRPDADRGPWVACVALSRCLRPTGGSVTRATCPGIRLAGWARGPGGGDGRSPGSLFVGTLPAPRPERGTHLTEPRQLPFSFSWLSLGRCFPVGHRRVARPYSPPFPAPPGASVALASVLHGCRSPSSGSCEEQGTDPAGQS